MAIRAEQTPNPNAVKFSVGKEVGGPATHLAGQEAGSAWVDALLQLEGVASIFLVADFVTVTKTPEGTWDEIEQAAAGILSAEFGS